MPVYKGTNTANGMVYIGACQRSLRVRLNEHKSRAFREQRRGPLYDAIRLYGWGAFDWQVLEEPEGKAALVEAEQKWIARLGSNDPDVGYNQTAGGLGAPGFKVSQETKRRLSAAHTGRSRSPEAVARTAAKLKGRKPSPETMRALIGRVVSEETRQKQREFMTGRKMQWSPEARQRFAETMRRRGREGIWSKIDPALAPHILKRRASGETFASIAASYGVKPSTIFYFCKRHSE